MYKHYSILHISDLHKAEGGNYANLLTSLQRDCESYTATGVAKPEIIVVSGDLVEGCRDGDAERVIRNQYQETTVFLDGLVNYFLNGDRHRLVIVPGNHDFNMLASARSMDRSIRSVADDKKLLRLSDPKVRFSWDDLSFYHINREDEYEKRFELFREFYDSFFSGIRLLPKDLFRDSNVVELDEYGIAFACFNSCYRLDHLNPMGCICPDALSASHERLRKLKKMGYLLIGVWHHHVSGLPAENNYMDHRILEGMMQEDIKVGLYGHQHVSTIVNEFRDVTGGQNILLISSGSLYGNRSQLVTGVPRQYNVIEVDRIDSNIMLTLNVRKDVSQYGYAIPSWQTSPIGTGNLDRFSYPVKLHPVDLDYCLADIEEVLSRNGDYGEACFRLKHLGLEDIRTLKYFESYLAHIKDDSLLLRLLESPTSVTQYMYALNAAMTLHDRDSIRRLLRMEQYAKMHAPFVEELVKKAQNQAN
jgi:hypothetical protein